MQRFTIENLAKGKQTCSPRPINIAKIMFANHDGVVARDGANYLNSSLHLDDVYSIISKDVPLSALTKDVTIPEVVPQYCHDATTTYHTMDVKQLDQTNQAFGAVPIQKNSQPEENDTTVDHDLSPLCSPIDESRGRGTPSPPLHDSGIESDNSPTASQLSKTLKTLNKKAAAVQSRKVIHSKSSSDSSPDADEKEKPRQSYISLIVQAILSSPDSRMTLGDIYRHISDNHSYYDNEERSWRNSIRYNLSINECFMKNGKEESGKGNYWTIHPACLDDFRKGDYRRRQARRRAKRNVKTVNSASTTSSVPMGSYVPMTSCVTGYQSQQGLSDVPGHRYGAHPLASAQTTLPHTMPHTNIPYYSMMPPYGSVPVYASPYHTFPPMSYAFMGSSAQPEMNSRGIAPAPTWYTSPTNSGSAYEPEVVSDSNTVVIKT